MKNKSFQDLEKELLKNNEDLTNKFLELETLLDLTNTINSQEDLKSLFFNILTISSSILNSSKGTILIRDQVSKIFNPISAFNMEDEKIKKQIFNTKKGFLNDLNQEKKVSIIEVDQHPNMSVFESEYAIAGPLMNKNKLVGVILLFNKESRSGYVNFDENDKKLLDGIAKQSSIAYQNILLLESLIKANQLNENIMSSITTGVIEVNLFGEIEFANKESLRILEMDTSDILGNHYHYIFEKNKNLIKIIERVELEKKSVFELDFELQSKKKKVMTNLSCSPVFNDKNDFSGIVVAIDDQSKINKIKSTFKKYVSKNIVDKLLDNEDSLNLGGKESDVTILFSDIRGFTSMSEKLEPTEIVEVLNRYFKEMIKVVFEFNGTLDKIVGDELMVLYGAPLENDNDCDDAVNTAIKMFESLEKFNAEVVKDGFKPIEIGIGINKGKVVSGNIGSDQQMNYTVIGDSVNLGSRLCSNAKPGELLISNFVKENLKKNYNFKKIPSIMVKGKAKPIEVWSYKHSN